MPSEVWRVGDVTITKVVEREMSIPVEALEQLLPASTRDEIDGLSWMKAHYLSRGQVTVGYYSFLVGTPLIKIVVDTAVGNAKARAHQNFHMLDTAFLKDFCDVWKPDDVDGVVNTHLHPDHVGWNTRLVDGAWQPSFPNATYYLVDDEYRHLERCALAGGADPVFDAAAVLADSVRPIVDAGLATLVEPAASLASEVTLVPSHGHTPGHVAVLIESKGESAVITGDLLHTPCQIGRPDWSCVYDDDQDAAAVTRRSFLERFADSPTVVIGTHFGTPSGVRVARDGTTFRLSPVG